VLCVHKKDPSSCHVTKREHGGPKPDLNTLSTGGREQEEYCENCGRVNGVAARAVRHVMSCPGYNEDPPCKTFRKAEPEQQQKQSCSEPTVKIAHNAERRWCLRQGAYGEFVFVFGGYPKCKYVKQNIIEG